MKKILIVHQDGKITGSAISLIYMIQGFDKTKYNIEVLCLGEGKLINEIKQMDIKVTVIESQAFWTAPGPSFFSRGFIRNIKGLFIENKIKNHLEKTKPDIIHINDKAALKVALQCKKMAIPTVLHLRSTYYETATFINKIISKYIISKYVDTLIAINEDTFEEFKKNNNLVYNSIDINEIEECMSKKEVIRKQECIGNNYINIGWVGKFNAGKGAWDFLETCHLLNNNKDTLPKIKFHMIGKLPSSNLVSADKRILNKILSVFRKSKQSDIEYFNFLSENRNLNNVKYYGYRNDYLDIISCMDIMINSNQSVFGRQIFESMILGIPMVATHKFHKKSNMVTQSSSGLVVEAKNVSEIVEASKKLILNTSYRMELGKNGRNFALNNFDKNTNSKKISDLYDKLLK
jgi:glycosyltransferase involved in cell wall biosynthesis